MGTHKNNPAISLIIPVYNVEDYLEKSLISVANQTMTDFEVILVNDGSTDSSLQIMQEFAKKHKNFTIISQRNKGLSGARNTGLRAARGKYVAFLDSDDYIAQDFLESLYTAAEETQAEIAYCNYKIYYPKINFSFSYPFSSKSTLYSKEKALKKLILDTTLRNYSWNKLCRKSLFFENDIVFEDMYFEDISTSPRLFYFAKKIAVNKKGLYYYTKRSGSILSTMNAKKINDYAKAFGMIRDFLERQGDYKEYSREFRLYGYKVACVNFYSVLRMHIKQKNFSGVIENIKNATKTVQYFLDDEYCLQAQVEVPYLIQEPSKFPKKPISKKKPKRKSKIESSISGE